MRYTILNNELIELVFEHNEDIASSLRMIAQHSYALAKPRGLGYLQSHKETSTTFDSYIQRRGFGLSALIMDYINGRDCRTCITTYSGKWIFNTYAFEQREVTATEFLQGKRAIRATEFLDEVIEKLNDRGRRL